MTTIDCVLVLMSTHNGEKYLEEQITSIKNQKEVCVHLLVRDDNSRDKTCQILNSLLDPKRDVLQLDNNWLGVYDSYSTLANYGGISKYEFVAFSDQDDVWHPEKLKRALSFLKDKREYQMYCSNRTIVNSNLENLNRRKTRRKSGPINTKELIRRNFVFGNTMVVSSDFLSFSNKFHDISYRHFDFHLGLIGALTKTLYFDSHPTLLYRIHDHNDVGIPKLIRMDVLRILENLLFRIRCILNASKFINDTSLGRNSSTNQASREND